MVLAREFGNCVTDCELVETARDSWLFRGIFVDLETGNTTTRLYRKAIPKVEHLRNDFEKERAMDTQFQIGQSKAIRNAVLNAMTAGLVSRAIATAKKADARETVKDSGGPQKAIEKIQRAFKGHGVTLEMLERRIDKPAKQWGEEEIGELRAIFTALEDGQTSVAQEFDADPGEPPPKSDGDALFGDKLPDQK